MADKKVTALTDIGTAIAATDVWMVNDSVAKLSECSELNSKNIRNMKRKYYITGLAKRSLGNKMYEKLRERIIGGEK